MAKKIKIGGFKTQLWNACGNDILRPVMSHAHVMNGFIYATDAHILIKQSLKNVHGLDEEQVSNLEGKSFHKELLQFLDKQDVVTFNTDGIHVTGKGIGTAVIDYSVIDGRFPNAEAVIPQEDHAESIDFIGIKPKILDRLVKSMYPSDEGFRFTFYGKNRCILMRGQDFDRSDEIGLIMPCETKSW